MMIATPKQNKRIKKGIEALTDIANEANLLWNDNIDPEANMKLRDLAWSAVASLKLVRDELTDEN